MPCQITHSVKPIWKPQHKADFPLLSSRTPQEYRGIDRRGSRQTLQERFLPHKWSVGEIIAHLTQDELVSSWRYRQMIENSGCVLSAFDQDAWARLGDYSSRKPWDSLLLFRLLRETNLRMLNQLTANEWERFGLHAERGKIMVRGCVATFRVAGW